MKSTNKGDDFPVASLDGRHLPKDARNAQLPDVCRVKLKLFPIIDIVETCLLLLEPGNAPHFLVCRCKTALGIMGMLESESVIGCLPGGPLASTLLHYISFEIWVVKPKGQYRDHLVGQLTGLSRNRGLCIFYHGCLMFMFTDTFVFEIVHFTVVCTSHVFVKT